MLDSVNTKELEEELARRKEIKEFEIRGVKFQLSLEEVLELQSKLNEINPPKSSYNYLNQILNLKPIWMKENGFNIWK